MGRVYTLEAEQGADVRPAHGCRVFTALGEKIPCAVRVALDADADEGMATVQLIPTSSTGSPLLNPQAGEVCRAEIRTWVRVAPKGQPDPPLTPDAVLYKQADGSLQWFANDPLPDEAIAAFNAAGAATQG